MKTLKHIIAPLLLIITVAGCKTSEANYRSAYEKAVAARDEAKDEDSLYGNSRQNMNVRTVTGANGDVEVRLQIVKITPEGGGADVNMRRYNVVAAQFKQKFNAISLRNRMAEKWPDALVVETSDSYFYVIVSSQSKLDDALFELEKLRNQKLAAVKEPCPFILDATIQRASR